MTPGMTRERIAAEAKREAGQRRAEYEDVRAEFARMGDSADGEDASWLAGFEAEWKRAVARWHGCAPEAAEEWWPGGWRVRSKFARVGYLGSEPLATRAAAEAVIAAATPAQPALHGAEPVWVAVDGLDTGSPTALDRDYWSAR